VAALAALPNIWAGDNLPRTSKSRVGCYVAPATSGAPALPWHHLRVEKPHSTSAAHGAGQIQYRPSTEQLEKSPQTAMHTAARVVLLRCQHRLRLVEKSTSMDSGRADLLLGQ
jgi:hypothetical protein